MTHLIRVVVSGLGSGAIYAMVALGFVLVYRGTKVINFAQGEYVMVGGVVAGAVYEAFDVHILIPIVAGLSAGLFAGLLTQVLVSSTRRARDNPHLVTLVTIGFAVALKAAVMVTTDRQTYQLPGFTNRIPITVAGATVNGQVLLNVTMMAVSAVLLMLFFRYTRRGLWLRATADDPETAEAYGVSSTGSFLWSFGLAGLLGGLVGIGLTPLALISFDSGTLLGLKGFSAAVIGGLASPAGAIIGGLILGLAEAFVAGYGPSAYADVVAFVALLGILLARPTGIFREVSVDRV
ncbi:MAG: branched-chain amino acid ABC transporter permease [Acidimicrobiia bacterium]